MTLHRSRSLAGANSLKVLYANADQLVAGSHSILLGSWQLPHKMEEQKVMIMNREPDIIVITEVIPKAQEHPIVRPRLKLPGYNEFLNFDPYTLVPRQCGKRGIIIRTNVTLGHKCMTFQAYQMSIFG